MLHTSIKFDYPLKNSWDFYAQEFDFTLEGTRFGINQTTLRTLYSTKYGRIIAKEDPHWRSISFHGKNGVMSNENGGYYEYDGKKYKMDTDIYRDYVNIFGKFDSVKNINPNYFRPCFNPSNKKVPNDLALDSLKKANNAIAKFLHGKLPNALDFKNIAGIWALNDSNKVLNTKVIPLMKELGFLDVNTPLQPILSDDQLIDLSNKLAGEAGEELVDEAVKIDNKKFHNVILDYNYGNKQNTFSNNQIDNIFITHTGIYCVEVKTRNVKNGVFNMQDLIEQGIKDQIGYHKDAVLNVLRDPENHLKEILPENLSSLIYNVVVIVNRHEKDFQIANAEELTKFGAHILKLEDLNLAMTNGLKEDIYLTDEQMNKIARAIEKKNIGAKGERSYSDNIVFFNDTKIGNKFTLTENDIIKNQYPGNIAHILMKKGIENEKKKSLPEKQRKMLDFLDYMTNSPFNGMAASERQIYNFKDPFNLPEIESNHEYDQLFKEQEENKSKAYSGLINFNEVTGGKYLFGGENYDLEDAVKYYEKDYDPQNIAAYGSRAVSDYLERNYNPQDATKNGFKNAADYREYSISHLGSKPDSTETKDFAQNLNKATNFNRTSNEVNDFLEQKSQGSSCLSSAALIALIVGIIPALLHMLI